MGQFENDSFEWTTVIMARSGDMPEWIVKFLEQWGAVTAARWVKKLKR